MSIENFIAIQNELFGAFWLFARWWMILFVAAGILLGLAIFFLEIVGNWFEAR